MGLDVYLYKYENKPETDRLENEYETLSQANWDKAGDYDSLSQVQKDLVHSKNEEVAKKLGLDSNGIDGENKVRIEIDSAIDKEHYFKIGYFRSSYNDNGINTVLKNLGVPSLYAIFEPNDEYCFQPDWERALKRCEKSIAILEKKGNYRGFNISPNIFGQPPCTSEKQALEVFMEELAKKGSFSGGYSNNKGCFYHEEPLKVLALIPGTENLLSRSNPCTYVICEGDNSWYLTALQIVKETINYVLSQTDKEKYYLHWSG